MTEHIKIPGVTPIIRYVANGTQTEFEFPFPIFASEDIQIELNDAVQSSGYLVSGVAETNGGSVTFDSAPANGVVVVIKRNLPIERFSDFLEGGDFSARALNSELDYLTASVQQVARETSKNLRYQDSESDISTILPSKNLRAGKALAFDGEGNPTVVDHGTTQVAPNYTAVGTGTTVRVMDDKMRDQISVKDFGAVGDGVADDTIAFQNALQSYDHIFVPTGTYRITNSIVLSENKTLKGQGQKTIIKANNTSFATIEIQGSYNHLSNLRIEQGREGLKLYGATSPCVQNVVKDITIWGAQTGVLLDGYNDTNDPCYWNAFQNILVAQPSIHGIHLTKTGAGDTPNANRFLNARVYSLGATMSGNGFYIEHGSFNNSFVDCEANLNVNAANCVLVGAGSYLTLFQNLYTETTGVVTNVKLESGSEFTTIANLLAASAGAAIVDESGGSYQTYNAGFPTRNRFLSAHAENMNVKLQRYETLFTDPDEPSTVNVDTTITTHLMSAFDGAISAVLPAASSAVGVEIYIKKTDATGNPITITVDGGTGPDNKPLVLGGPYDYALLLSDGGQWYVKASNRLAGNTLFHDGSGLFEIDMSVDVYLLSSFGGALEARLPPANAPEAIGRQITIKKTDPSSNNVTITENGGSGPDNASYALTGQYAALSVVSNGGSWYITHKY